MALPAVACIPGVGDRRAARGWDGATAGAFPGLIRPACHRRLPAFARPSLRLPGADEAQR